MITYYDLISRQPGFHNFGLRTVRLFKYCNLTSVLCERIKLDGKRADYQEVEECFFRANTIGPHQRIQDAKCQ